MWLGCLPEVYYTEDRVHPQESISARPGWLRRNQTTCGMITGWGSHHVDIAHWGMDTEYTGPISVKGEATWPGPDSFWDVHGKYSLELKYANGVTLLVNDEFPNGIRFEGDDGWIWVSRGNYSATASDPTSGSGTRPLDASNRKWITEDLSGLDVQLHHSPNWDHHLDWLRAVRQRSEPATNVETGHRSGSACILSWIAMKLGRSFDWDPVRERSTDAEVNGMLSRPERNGYGALNRARAAGDKVDS
jgi:predicted dehydrogenase